jgi:hypothetical protein
LAGCRVFVCLKRYWSVPTVAFIISVSAHMETGCVTIKQICIYKYVYTVATCWVEHATIECCFNLNLPLCPAKFPIHLLVKFEGWLDCTDIKYVCVSNPFWHPCTDVYSFKSNLSPNHCLITANDTRDRTWLAFLGPPSTPTYRCLLVQFEAVPTRTSNHC